MKKLLIICLLILITMGTAFSQEDWGVGVLASFGGDWGQAGVGFGGALSLKIPNVPIYWGISLHARSSRLGIGLTGDYYLFRGTLVPDIGLGWYFGLGGWATFYTGSNYTGIAFGARAPLGLSMRIPNLQILEIFLSVSPSLGVKIDNVDNFYFPAGGWPIEIGFRIWF